jgi:HlyD family secretion protein
MRRSWIWTPVIVIAGASLSYFLYLVLQPPELPAGFLYGNGHIEGTEISVSAEVSGRVEESRLREGERVMENDLLARLDDSDFQAQLSKGLAEEAAIEAERIRVEEQLRIWRHHLRTASEDLQRYRQLKESAAISPQQLNAIEDREREANGQVRTLEAALAQTRASLEATRQQVRWLRLQLEKTRISAPVSGTVLVKGIEQGELASPGRVVAVLVDLSRLELKVYLPERDIGRIRLGDTARVRVDAFPDRYFGATVARVDQRAQFTPRDIHMPEERVRMVFGVTLSLENEDSYLKPGMPADAWIRVQEDAPWPETLTVPR